MSKRSACQERRVCDRAYLRREARSPGRPCNLQILKTALYAALPLRPDVLLLAPGCR